MTEELLCFLWYHCALPFLPSPQTSQVKSSRPSDKMKRRDLSERRGSSLLVPFPPQISLDWRSFCAGLWGSNGQSQPSGLSAQERGQLNKREEGLVGGASDKALLRGFM